ncbi:MAG: hypothetical protein OM95_14095 [Bdellovibrio sp. ArHS]|uniref:hypothetical protein n=1 Tax=Bdellovibrio sp. ArHS TaxID=1569284 RepID=UPI000582E9F5|nr:hypothetical protein [Bdellovibrio sp. ArHS]KHD87498.1 MAG: hypothetical protein OM95_14095 [Bdellovibrio sp. ArHS]
MKKMILPLLMLMFSSQAFASAFDSLNDQKLQGEAYSKLLSEAQNITISGDIHEGEKLTTILKAAEDYHAEMLDLLERGESIEDMKSPVSSVDTQCKINAQKTGAECIVFINFKPLGETAIIFSVELNEKQEVISISNRAEISRGA